jgi:energy-coupling factor transporter ATP-binding protein EcfA2
MLVHESELVSESDVEQKFVWQLLTNSSGLGFKAGEVQTKTNLARLTIGKGTGEKRYHPDYLVLLETVPILVVEAKAPGVDLAEAEHEVLLYAAQVNAHFPAGVNPCAWAIATNGTVTRLLAWDSKDAVAEFRLGDLTPTHVGFAKLLETCSRGSLAKPAQRLRAKLRVDNKWRALNLVGGTSVRDGAIAHNNFGSQVAIEFRHLFSASSSDERAFIARNAYVSSKRRERYVEPIERQIRAMSSPGVAHIPSLGDSGSPQEVSSQLGRGRALERQVMLLVGSPGSGKSTFVDHLVNVALPKHTLEKTVWLRVDLNHAPNDRAFGERWLLDELLRELRSVRVDVDWDELATLQKVFRVELNRLKKGALALLPEGSSEYLVRVADELLRWQNDPLVCVKATARFLCADASKLLVVVLDNSDKRERDIQLAMFEHARWLQNELVCLVVLPIRDVTYDRYRTEPPLDTALKDLVFRIDPPQFTEVLSSRVLLALKQLNDAGKDRLEYALPNGARVSYPASDLGMYLASIMRSLYEHDRFVRRIMSGIAGRDVRRALEIFMDFCQSGYISSAEIFKIQQAEGRYTIPLSVVSAVLLRMHQRFYEGDRSYLKNLFQADNTEPTLNNFGRFWVLRHLHTMDRDPMVGLSGYTSVGGVVRTLGRVGVSSARCLSDIQYLVEAGCVVTEHLRLGNIVEEDLVALSPAGLIHLELADNIHYLAACAEDSWVGSSELAERVCDRIVSSRLGHISVRTAVFNASDFAQYLAERMDVLKVENPVFSHDGSLSHLFNLNPILESVAAGVGELSAVGGESRVFVANLPFDATEDQLAAVCESRGIEVRHVRLHRRDDGLATGSAHVFPASGSAEAAVNRLSGLVLGERVLRFETGRGTPRAKS